MFTNKCYRPFLKYLQNDKGEVSIYLHIAAKTQNTFKIAYSETHLEHILFDIDKNT